jgi:hypothetical protein
MIGRILYLVAGTICLFAAPIIFVISGSADNARDNALLIDIALFAGIGFMIGAVSFGAAESRRRQNPAAHEPPMRAGAPLPPPQPPWGNAPHGPS